MEQNQILENIKRVVAKNMPPSSKVEMIKEFLEDYQPATQSDIYFKFPENALQTAVTKARLRGYKVSQKDIDNAFSIGGFRVGETSKVSLTLFKNDKEQRKMLHVSLYQMESGMIELTDYIN